MYYYQPSPLDFQAHITKERKELGAEELILLRFISDLGLKPYVSTGVLAQEAEARNRGGISIANMMKVVLKGKYQHQKDRVQSYGNSYTFANTELLLDYVIERVNEKVNCRINLQRWEAGSGRAGTNFSSYYEAGNAEDVITQVIDLMVEDKRFMIFEAPLRRYKIDAILRDLEENL